MSFVVKFNKFRGASARARRGVATGLLNAKTPILNDLRRRTPIDTGELRDSQTVTADGASLTMRATALHSVPVHQGTRFMTARPWMRDTAEANLGTVENAVIAAIESELA